MFLNCSEPLFAWTIWGLCNAPFMVQYISQWFHVRPKMIYFLVCHESWLWFMLVKIESCWNWTFQTCLCRLICWGFLFIFSSCWSLFFLDPPACPNILGKFCGWWCIGPRLRVPWTYELVIWPCLINDLLMVQTDIYLQVYNFFIHFYWDFFVYHLYLWFNPPLVILFIYITLCCSLYTIRKTFQRCCKGGVDIFVVSNEDAYFHNPNNIVNCPAISIWILTWCHVLPWIPCW